jgi:hypothetical protein
MPDERAIRKASRKTIGTRMAHTQWINTLCNLRGLFANRTPGDFPMLKTCGTQKNWADCFPSIPTGHGGCFLAMRAGAMPRRPGRC